MANHDIQNSLHLLKRLKEEMEFLDSLMAETQTFSSKATSLTHQVRFAASNLYKTWSSLHVSYESWKKRSESCKEKAPLSEDFLLEAGFLTKKKRNLHEKFFSAFLRKIAEMLEKMT